MYRYYRFVFSNEVFSILYDNYRYIYVFLLLNTYGRRNNLPIIRRLIPLGNSSKGISLPKTWLDFLEKKHGSIDCIALEVNGKITIRPIFKEALRNEKNNAKNG